MKMSKAEGAAVLITAILLSLALGFYIGRSTVKTAVVVEAASPEETVTTIPTEPPAEALTAASAVPEEAVSSALDPEETAETPETAVVYPLDLNTADLSQLETLPKIGPVLAQRIIDYRSAQNGFTYIEELKNVEGIGEGIYDKIKDLVEVRN